MGCSLNPAGMCRVRCVVKPIRWSGNHSLTAWIAQSLQYLPSAQVEILGSWDQAPCSVWSLLLPLLPACALSLCLSLALFQINKIFKKRERDRSHFLVPCVAEIGSGHLVSWKPCSEECQLCEGRVFICVVHSKKLFIDQLTDLQAEIESWKCQSSGWKLNLSFFGNYFLTALCAKHCRMQRLIRVLLLCSGDFKYHIADKAGT